MFETHYLVKAKIVADKQAITREHEKLGKFVLATNDLYLMADENPAPLQESEWG